MGKRNWRQQCTNPIQQTNTPSLMTPFHTLACLGVPWVHDLGDLGEHIAP